MDRWCLNKMLDMITILKLQHILVSMFRFAASSLEENGNLDVVEQQFQFSTNQITQEFKSLQKADMHEHIAHQRGRYSLWVIYISYLLSMVIFHGRHYLFCRKGQIVKILTISYCTITIMRSSSWHGIDRQRLKENIVLLGMLDKEPEKPEENQVPSHLAQESNENLRQLSFARERDLVDNLAFLSAPNEHAKKVVAVCVEENPNAEELRIRIAMNTDGLQLVKNGLSRITAILERVARRGWPSLLLKEPFMLTTS